MDYRERTAPKRKEEGEIRGIFMFKILLIDPHKLRLKANWGSWLNVLLTRSFEGERNRSIGREMTERLKWSLLSGHS